MDAEETERERMLHAIYDAWTALEDEAEILDKQHYAGLSRAILRGQLKAAEYTPYLKRNGK